MSGETGVFVVPCPGPALDQPGNTEIHPAIARVGNAFLIGHP